MKKILIMLSLISLVFLWWCKFLWWGSDDSQNQPIQKNTTKSSFDNVYTNYISTWENKVATLKKMNSVQHKNEKFNFWINFDIESPFVAWSWNLNLDVDTKTSLPKDYTTTTQLKQALFDWIFKVNWKVKWIFQWQSLDANINANLLINLVWWKLYAKLNELVVNDANNPSIWMMLATFEPFKWVWLELFEMPTDETSSQLMITSPDDVFNFVSDVIRLTKENIIVKVLEEKMEWNTKVFVVTLDNDKFIELMKKINQLESLKKLNWWVLNQISPEQEAEIKKELEKLQLQLAVKVSDTDWTIVEIQKFLVNWAMDITWSISDKQTSLVLNSIADWVQVKLNVDKNWNNYKSTFAVFQWSLEMINLEWDFDVKNNNGFYDVKWTLIAKWNWYNISTSLEYISTEWTQLNLTAPEWAQKIEEIMWMWNSSMPNNMYEDMPDMWTNNIEYPEIQE